MLRIVSLTSVFPNVLEPRAGLFVHTRLTHIADIANVKVVAPVLRFDYAARFARPTRVPTAYWSGRLQVFHPRWLYIPGAGALTPFQMALQMESLFRQLIREFQFEIIDAHFGFPEGIAAAILAMRLRVPFAVTLRGSELLHRQHALRCRELSWALRRASLVIVLSEELQRLATTLGVPAERLAIVPNGVDTNRFFPRDRNVCRETYSLPQGPIILSAGHLIELKGHHHIIRSLARLHQRGVRAFLIIAGAEPARGIRSYRATLTEMVAQAGLDDYVKFAGLVSPDELAVLMSAADVFCLASSREGWPNVLHEALACGCPAVATEVGAVRDLVQSPDCGFVVPPADDAALAGSLYSALTTTWNRAEISAKAQARSWRTTAVEVVTHMQRVLRSA